MFWFKNAMIYRLTKQIDWDLPTLQDRLAGCLYRPCYTGESSQTGWIAPLCTSDSLYFAAGKQILLTVYKEEKLLPAYVITRKLNERIAKLEQEEGRKLKKTEKQALKDDVAASLLPQAFSKYQHTAIWINTETNLIYVDATSSNRAEAALALLRKSLGSLPVVPLHFINEPVTVMTNWVIHENYPRWLSILEEANFKAADNHGLIHCKDQALDTEEIVSLLKSGKYATKLALDWEEHLSFVLNDDGTLKRLKFADNIRERNDDILKEDIAQRFDADFALMTGELTELTTLLINEFGGIRVID